MGTVAGVSVLYRCASTIAGEQLQCLITLLLHHSFTRAYKQMLGFEDRLISLLSPPEKVIAIAHLCCLEYQTHRMKRSR